MFEGELPPDVTERVLASTSVTTYGYIYDGGQLRRMTVTTTVTADEETTTQTDTLAFTFDASSAPQTLTWGENTYLYAVNAQGGMPVARERRALEDLAYANLYVVFVEYI